MCDFIIHNYSPIAFIRLFFKQKGSRAKQDWKNELITQLKMFYLYIFPFIYIYLHLFLKNS